MAGKGTMFYADKSKYHGEFKNGYREGIGSLYDKNGNLSYNGSWTLNKQGSSSFLSGKISGFSHYELTMYIANHSFVFNETDYKQFSNLNIPCGIKEVKISSYVKKTFLFHEKCHYFLNANIAEIQISMTKASKKYINLVRNNIDSLYPYPYMFFNKDDIPHDYFVALNQSIKGTSNTFILNTYKLYSGTRIIYDGDVKVYEKISEEKLALRDDSIIIKQKSDRFYKVKKVKHGKGVFTLNDYQTKFEGFWIEDKLDDSKIATMISSNGNKKTGYWIFIDKLTDIGSFWTNYNDPKEWVYLGATKDIAMVKKKKLLAYWAEKERKRAAKWKAEKNSRYNKDIEAGTWYVVGNWEKLSVDAISRILFNATSSGKKQLVKCKSTYSGSEVTIYYENTSKKYYIYSGFLSTEYFNNYKEALEYALSKLNCKP